MMELKNKDESKEGNEDKSDKTDDFMIHLKG